MNYDLSAKLREMQNKLRLINQGVEIKHASKQ